jgi:hypothetical protein
MLPWYVTYRAALSIVTRTPKYRRDFATIQDVTILDLSDCTEVILSFQRVPYGTSNELLANLWMFRNRLASLDHDKVYGILGMVRHGDLNCNRTTKYLSLCYAAQSLSRTFE